MDVVILPKDYPLLLDEIRVKGSAFRKDRAGRLCEIVLDQQGRPHRSDWPHIHVKFKNNLRYVL